MLAIILLYGTVQSAGAVGGTTLCVTPRLLVSSSPYAIDAMTSESPTLLLSLDPTSLNWLKLEPSYTWRWVNMMLGAAVEGKLFEPLPHYRWPGESARSAKSFADGPK